MNDAVNPTVLEFIKEFEAKFGQVLREPEKSAVVTHTDYFKIFTDQEKKKYSDWDIECFLKMEVITEQDILAIDKFVREYRGFKYVGHLLTFSEKYRNIWHHADKIECLPFMAFMPGVSFAPFFDIHVWGISSEIIQKVYAGKSDEEIVDWLMFTALRKIRNGVQTDIIDKFLETFILPTFPEDKEKIIENPAAFITEQFVKQNKFAEALDFLNN